MITPRRLILLLVLVFVAAIPAGLAAQADPTGKPPAVPRQTVIVDPYEPNDSAADATPFEINGLRNGIVDPEGDVDYYGFWAEGGQTILAEIDASEVGSPLDPTLTLYDVDGVTELAFDDDSDPDLDPRLSYTLPAGGYYYLKVAGFGDSTGYYWLFLTGGDAYEPNNRPSQAKRIPIGDQAMGTIDPPGDDDWFKFRAEAGQLIDIDIDAWEFGSWLDSYITVFDRDGRTVMYENDDFNGLDSFIVFSVPVTGTYFVRVQNLYDGEGGPQYFYTLKLALNQTWLFSPGKGGTISGVRFAANDILRYDGNTGEWELFFDASDVGVTANLGAFDYHTFGCLMLSFAAAQNLPTLGKVTPQDVVEFCPYSLGEETSGDFYLMLDGSDVGLTTSGEAIDALDWDGSNWALHISTLNNAVVPGFGDTDVAAADEDILRLNVFSLGTDSDGLWELAVDGSAFAGMAGEDIGGLGYLAATGEYWLSMKDAFTIEGVAGDANDIITLRPDWSTGNFRWLVAPVWDGSAAGFTFKIDGIARLLPQ